MRTALIFPGQGAQYVGMGRDFFDSFQIVRETFEEAETVLGRKLTETIFEGPMEKLTETRNAQIALFVVCLSTLRVLQSQMEDLTFSMTAGLSLGEYCALVASGKASFAATLKVVSLRADLMMRACEEREGSMAAILGLEGAVVEEVVAALNLPADLWVANYNCPGQVVISGTKKGLEKGCEALLAKGAKRAVPLQVSGAFHSGLMSSAEEGLQAALAEFDLLDSSIDLVMNVTGQVAGSLTQIRQGLSQQVTHSVRWEQSIRTMDSAGVERYIEIGPQKSLSAFNKRIGIRGTTSNVDKMSDLDLLAGRCV